MAFLEKGVLLYLTLAIACVFWQPQVILSNDFGNVNMMSWFGVELNQSDNNDSIMIPNSLNQFNNEDLVNQTQTGAETEAGFFKRGFDFSTNLFQFIIDGLANVLGVLQVLLQVLFSPFVIFFFMVTSGAPLPIMFIFAIPLIMMFFVGFIYFIRGGT